jgi:CxxC motif-containing protein
MEGNTVVGVSGYGCKNGKAYATDEAVCPRRTVCSTVKTASGEMLAVKTDEKVKKTEIFQVMEKISAVMVDGTVRIGDIIIKNIVDGVNLVATDNLT